MKSFRELIEEKEKDSKPVVMAFGRMNPPTTGHLKLIDKVKSTAEKLGAKHTVVVSHTQDSKKNPLSAEQKIKHLKRYSPGTHIEAASKEHPTILHHASKLHDKDHDELHVVAGSDRVKEMHHLLHQYNGVKGKHGYYKFKKIQVHSAGHRDPDAEGAEGMSGTKMREHAKNKDFHSFRQGVPHHVKDEHAKELMHDVRKGMGLHESTDHGRFYAIFVTGGPGSGKDIVIREAIAESHIVELNFIQAQDYLGDKQKLSEKTNDYRREAIRQRGPLIINGPADDKDKISHIKEELESLGYETMMIFVNTTDEVSKERNSLLSRMMMESVRQDKWSKSQRNTKYFTESFKNFIVFDNTGDIHSKEYDIHEVYENTKVFLDSNTVNETAEDWLNRKFKIEEENNVKTNNRFLKVAKNYSSPRAKGPDDITHDNQGSIVPPGQDQVKGNTGARKDNFNKGHSGGAWHAAYEESQPITKVYNKAKESNFQQDKDKIKLKKRGFDKSGKESALGRPDGLGSSWDTRTNGSGLTGGMGLGNQTYSEGEEYSNANPASTAMPAGITPNPLGDSAYTAPKKEFKKFRKTIKEYNGFQNEPESGFGGMLGGSDNKEYMDSYKDPNRNIGIEIVKKKKKNK